jgi:peptide-methionine (S)-S-oxide reductase
MPPRPLTQAKERNMNRLFALLVASALAAPASAVSLPDPAADVPLARSAGVETAVLAGGCFWGVEGVFEHVEGVTRVVSGYAGGTAQTANYRTVSSGRSGHAESVRISYDPAKISYGQLLRVFFAVAHDPTQLNRQGPDSGPQYRSAIFTTSPEQKRVAERYVAQLQQARAYPRPIVTQVVPLEAFFEAEAYHQDYMAKHPDLPYIVAHDRPKLDNLKRELPALYRPAAAAKTQKTR